jgi:two-component system, OmpR family, alkaline phosphatase synthesis response regulator PhoP
MPALILLSKDSQKAREWSRFLVQQGFTCSIIKSVSESEDSAWNNVKLVIADANSEVEPDKESIIKDIRYIKDDRKLSIIVMISKEINEDAELTALADDFITAPVNVHELALRIHKVLSFKKKTTHIEDIMNFGDIVIDTAQAEVTVDGNNVPLTFKEYELLKFLAKHKGRVYSREALLNEVWGFDYYGGDRTVDVHIRRLRGKIEATGHTFIDTVRNIGYKFITGS